MKKLSIVLITVLVLLFACGTALAGAPNAFGTSNGGGTSPDLSPINVVEPDSPIAPVPEPTTMLLLGSGLAVLAMARKRKK